MSAIRKNTKKSAFFSVTAMMLWSTVATAFFLALKNADFYEVLYVSIISSTVVLFTSVTILKKFRKIFVRKDLLKSSIYGILNPFLYYIILFKAYSLLKIQVAQGLNYTWPIILSLLTALFLRQKISTKDIVSLVICFAGAMIIIFGFGGNNSLSEINIFGASLGVLSAFIWSFYWLLNLMDSRDEIVKTFQSFFFGSLYMSIFLLLTKNFSFSWGFGLLYSLYIGVFEMSLTFIIWIFALRTAVNASRAGNIIYLTPFVSLFFIRFVGKERIQLSTFLGLVIILSGIVVQNFYKKNYKWTRKCS